MSNTRLNENSIAKQIDAIGLSRPARNRALAGLATANLLVNALFAVSDFLHRSRS